MLEVARGHIHYLALENPNPWEWKKYAYSILQSLFEDMRRRGFHMNMKAFLLERERLGILLSYNTAWHARPECSTPRDGDCEGQGGARGS